MTVLGAGMTLRLKDKGDEAAPRLRRYRAKWIPAYAGMTATRGGSAGGGAR